MQEANIKLKEIIWEITGKCNNKCSYCGSKKTWNVEIDNEKIIDIAKYISMYPPDELNISGGDPLLVDIETHKKIVEILKTKNIKCKILINPKSRSSNNTQYAILKLYDWIGISVNTQEEIDLADNYNLNIFNKSTIITNFNLDNIFLYDEIERLVKEKNLIWQIQYTMYHNPNCKLSLYNNPKAIQYFSKKISQSINDKTKIILADNMTSGKCVAGTNSLGILYNGDVVPCLSMRSWIEKIDSIVVANLFGPYSINPLQEIWINGFSKYRFESFKCCKDHCKNQCIKIEFLDNNKSNGSLIITLDEFKKYFPKEYTPEEYTPPRTILYGVQPSHTFVYGAADGIATGLEQDYREWASKESHHQWASDMDKKLDDIPKNTSNNIEETEENKNE